MTVAAYRSRPSAFGPVISSRFTSDLELDRSASFRPRAVIFDLDGTLVDNMPLHAQAFERFAEAHDLPPLTMDLRRRIDGKRNSEIFPMLFEREMPMEEILQFEEEKEGAYRQTLAWPDRTRAGRADAAGAARGDSGLAWRWRRPRRSRTSSTRWPRPAWTRAWRSSRVATRCRAASPSPTSSRWRPSGCASRPTSAWLSRTRPSASRRRSARAWCASAWRRPSRSSSSTRRFQRPTRWWPTTRRSSMVPAAGCWKS